METPPPQKSSTSAQTNRRQAQEKFTKVYRGASITHPFKANTQEVQRAFRKHFDGFSRSAFFIRFYSERIGSLPEQDKIIASIKATITATTNEINKRSSLADKLLVGKKQGQSDFSTPSTYNAVIIDPLSMMLLSLLENADELTRKYYALWLNCVMDDQQFRKANDEIRILIAKVHSSTQRTSIGLRNRVHPLRQDETAHDQPADNTPPANSPEAVDTPSDNNDPPEKPADVNEGQQQTSQEERKAA